MNGTTISVGPLQPTRQIVAPEPRTGASGRTAKTGRTFIGRLAKYFTGGSPKTVNGIIEIPVPVRPQGTNLTSSYGKNGDQTVSIKRRSEPAPERPLSARPEEESLADADNTCLQALFKAGLVLVNPDKKTRNEVMRDTLSANATIAMNKLNELRSNCQKFNQNEIISRQNEYNESKAKLNAHIFAFGDHLDRNEDVSDPRLRFTQYQNMPIEEMKNKLQSGIMLKDTISSIKESYFWNIRNNGQKFSDSTPPSDREVEVNAHQLINTCVAIRIKNKGRSASVISLLNRL